ncbi:MAG: hypothetical protein GY834_10455 [Bacteroidetes bacterium]|nr:hypothetical protein [Bacteroidota bacterium]
MKKFKLVLISLLIITLLSFKLNATTSIKVALILDTSNSMDGLIDQAKSQLWSVINELATAKCNGETPDLQIALYEYGNDRLPMREGYIRLLTQFTGDLDLISKELFALKTNGGSEFCGQVIESALKELDWEDYPNDLKLIFIAGNEPFDQGNVSFREVCNTTRDKDITVNTIYCGNFNEGVQTHWKEGASISGGEYMNIDQDRQYIYIKSPYDERILKLNDRLNKTYVAYGEKGNSYLIRQAKQDNNARSMSAEVAIKRTASKSKSVYKNVQWDLVDASEEEGFDLEALSPKELPEEMKSMSIKEKKIYIEAKQKERKEIMSEINDLSKKRDQFVIKQSANNSSKMLDQAIIQSVKTQAKARNFQFEEEK